MAKRKVKLNFNGKEVEAEIIDINQSSEKWNEYLLDDGTSVRMKLVLQKAYKILGEFDNHGNPIYFFESTNIPTLDCPDDVKRKA